MLKEKICDLRPSVDEIDAHLLGYKRSNENLHTGTPGDRSCCRLVTHRHTVLVQGLSRVQRCHRHH
jgi:hypothetical protein